MLLLFEGLLSHSDSIGLLVLELLLNLLDLGIATLRFRLRIGLDRRQSLHKLSELLLCRQQFFLSALLALCRLGELLALLVDLRL